MSVVLPVMSAGFLVLSVVFQLEAVGHMRETARLLEAQESRRADKQARMEALRVHLSEIKERGR